VRFILNVEILDFFLLDVVEFIVLKSDRFCFFFVGLIN